MSVSQQPRAIVLVNGTRLKGIYQIEVNQNSFYQADTFRVTLAMSGHNVGGDTFYATSEDAAAVSMAYWSEITDAEIEIFFGFPSDPIVFETTELTSVFVGNIDEIEIDPGSDEVHLYGRDYTSYYIDNRTVEQYTNKTASFIATTLAKKYNLTPVVTATKSLVGAYYDRDRVSLNDTRPEWDLLTYLAEKEGFQVYVKGRELHFEPRLDIDKVKPFALKLVPTWSSNAKSIVMRRHLTLTRDVIVNVRSSNAQGERGFTQSVTRSNARNPITKRSTRLTLSPQIYTFYIPNLTRQEAQEKANKLALEISLNEKNLRFVIPADLSLTTLTPIELQGDSGGFYQRYYPSSITHRYSMSEGYLMDVEAKNHSPESTVTP